MRSPPGPAEQRKVKMHSLIDDPTRASRYLADQLSAAERTEYEACFLQDPAVIAELEATARLKVGLQQLRRSGELNELLVGKATAVPGSTWMLAMAATLAAVVIGVSLWWPHPRFSSRPVLAAASSAFTDRRGHTLSVLSTTPLFRTRAERYDAVIDLPDTRGAIRLRVLPSTPADSSRYQAALARLKDDNSSEAPVAVKDLQPSADDGFVDVYADTSLLSPGRYRLTLSREANGSAAGESDTFIIKVNAHH
jgi:hypothetical protein